MSDTDALDVVFLGTIEASKLFYMCVENGPNRIAEKYLKDDPWFAYRYALVVKKERWLEAEKAIAKNPDLLFIYLNEFIEERVPEWEHVLKNSTFWDEYKGKYIDK